MSKDPTPHLDGLRAMREAEAERQEQLLKAKKSKAAAPKKKKKASQNGSAL